MQTRETEAPLVPLYANTSSVMTSLKRDEEGQPPMPRTISTPSIAREDESQHHAGNSGAVEMTSPVYSHPIRASVSHSPGDNQAQFERESHGHHSSAGAHREAPPEPHSQAPYTYGYAYAPAPANSEENHSDTTPLDYRRGYHHRSMSSSSTFFYPGMMYSNDYGSHRPPEPHYQPGYQPPGQLGDDPHAQQGNAVSYRETGYASGGNTSAPGYPYSGGTQYATPTSHPVNAREPGTGGTMESNRTSPYVSSFVPVAPTSYHAAAPADTPGTHAASNPDETQREVVFLRQKLREKDDTIAELQHQVHHLESQISELRQLPTRKISHIPVADMIKIMEVYGSETSSQTIPTRKKDIKRTSVVRQFRRWNPEFFRYFVHVNGEWVPKLGKEGELKRREQKRREIKMQREIRDHTMPSY